MRVVVSEKVPSHLAAARPPVARVRLLERGQGVPPRRGVALETTPDRVQVHAI